MMLGRTLIIGGSSGLGAALANYLADSGVDVYVVGRRDCSQTCADNNNIHYSSIDISSSSAPDQFRQLFSRTRPNHIAFFHRFRAIEGHDTEVSLPELNLCSLHIKRLLDEYEALLSEQNELQSLLFCSSPAANFITSSQGLDYHLAKSVLNQMVRYYAVRLGKFGVRVNGISPSYFLKKTFSDLPENMKKRMQMVSQATPLGYIPEMQEICDVAEFLLSTKAKYVTGQNICLDGGLGLRLQDDLLL